MLCALLRGANLRCNYAVSNVNIQKACADWMKLTFYVMKYQFNYNYKLISQMTCGMSVKVILDFTYPI